MVEDLEELIQDATNANAHIPGSGASFYRSYLQTVLHNGNYWLSDIELLCLCACRRRSVVILKHALGAGSFIYRDSVMCEGSALAFTKFSVQPGRNVVRTHFDKVLRLSSGNANSVESSLEKKPDPAPPSFSTAFLNPGNRKRAPSQSSEEERPEIRRKT